jgi:hypothetical protein
MPSPVGGGNVDFVPDDKDRGRADEAPDDQRAGQRCDADRRQGLQRIAADNQLEGIERAGQRRIECSRDRAGRTASDKRADIVTAQLDRSAEPRCKGRAELGVGSLHTDRGSEPAGQQGRGDQAKAVRNRHPATEQGVRLDRVDDLARPPAPQQHQSKSDEQPTEERHR